MIDLGNFDTASIIALVSLYALKILGSLIILYVGKKVVALIISVLEKVMDKANFDKTLSKFFGNIVYTVLMVVIALAALSNVGVPTTSFVAMLGAVGLAVGLAFKDTFSNVGAGVLLIVFRPFKVDDFVSIGGEAGTIEEINLFSVLVRTGDNKIIIIPNGRILQGNITNFSRKETRRVDMTFSISYSDDLRGAKECIKKVVETDERILKDPEAFIAVGALADNSVDIICRVWVKTADYWAVNFDTIERVKLAFDEHGYTIPFPQMQLHN